MSAASDNGLPSAHVSSQDVVTADSHQREQPSAASTVTEDIFPSTREASQVDPDNNLSASADPVGHRSQSQTPVSANGHGPRRSVTIKDDLARTKNRGSISESGPLGSEKAGAKSASKHARSLSLTGRRSSERRQPSTPVDVLREPRRSIPRRPDEFDLGARDPHRGGGRWYKGEPVPREVAFAAPYTKTGIVLKKPSQWREWIVPGPLTFGHGQWWYLVLGQSLVAAVISAAINFGVGVATYNHYDADTPIYLWRWYPVPLAGDMGVTVIIQQIISMLITSALVHQDLAKGPIGPLRRPWPPLLHLPSTPSPKGSWLGVVLKSELQRQAAGAGSEAQPVLYMGKAEGKGALAGYFWWFVRSCLTGSERNDLLAKGISWRQRLERILWTAVQGFVLCLLTFWWYWPISIAIVAPIYGGRNLQGTYIPAIVKLLFGGILSLLTNPIMALLAMGAESSVRRAYPELTLWHDFGGREDYAAWLVEQRLAVDDVEIGPTGISRRSTQIRRDRPADLEAQSPVPDAEQPAAGIMASAAETSSDAPQVAVSPAPALSAVDHSEPAIVPTVLGGRPISRHITEEPTGSATVSS
ncbi:unnamed protein product [Parajaminaea phylloscopi]